MAPDKIEKHHTPYVNVCISCPCCRPHMCSKADTKRLVNRYNRRGWRAGVRYALEHLA